MVLLWIGGCDQPRSATPPAPLARRALATVYPLSDVLRRVAGNPTDVAWSIEWICENGQDPRTVTPTDEQLRLARRCDVIVSSGFGERWAGDMLSPEQRANTLVDPAATDAGRKYPTPHGALWLDIRVVGQVTDIVRERMSVIDPKHDEQYRKNAVSYEKELEVLEREYREQLTPLAGKKFLSLRVTWSPLVRRFGIQEVAPVDDDPSSLSDDDVEKIKQAARDQNISVLAVDASLLPGVQRELQLRTGLRLMPLDLIGTSAPDGRSTYAKLMRYNLNQLVQGLK